ncbi:YdcF family protein [Pseudothauera rhizosphaerae]|uniref:YdcF family protein n=1 Tax=Pseudothauera rhizosphaerae TaxID=2565932 RepID=A0A4S4AL62_9RHOO|nr:YdcF family protein [Pseudothauera rhizosphaerae]THF60235.1 YdcF family protein [Pseudothauera rhizosphaerae]
MSFDLSLVLFWCKKIVAAAIVPPLGPLLVIALGLALLRRRPRLGKALAWGGLVLNLLLVTPASVGLLLRPLEDTPPVTDEQLARAEAIVVVGAGKRIHAPEYGGETLNRLALERLRYAAVLARRSGLPVLVSGGAPTGTTPEANLMRDVLEREFGVPVRWVERASLDTRDNARYSAVHLQAAGVRRIALVTHAAHMPRSRAEFEAAGLEVIPAPTAWLGGRGANELVFDFLPGASSAYAGWYAVHEWVGRLAYRFSR